MKNKEGKKELSLLIIGSLPQEGLPDTYGGTTILLESFIAYCKRGEYNYSVITANKFNNGLFRLIRNYFYVFFEFCKRISASEVVMLNCASRGIIFLGPVLYIFTKIRGKKFVFRMFGGNFIELYNEYPFIVKFILKKTIFRSDILFFETLSIMDNFPKGSDTTKIAWLPNVRKSSNIRSSENYCKKFVFLGHIKETKGVIDILEATKLLGNGYTIDFYGPIKDPNIRKELFEEFPVNYKGVVEPKDILSTLRNYNVLLLPSFHSGEGYPGVILEALSIGLPVISTKWKSIPEIIEDGKNGFLVPIKSPEAIAKAIQEFNVKNYPIYRQKALESFENFNEEVVYKQVKEQMLSLN